MRWIGHIGPRLALLGGLAIEGCSAPVSPPPIPLTAPEPSASTIARPPLDLDVLPQAPTVGEQAIDDARATELRWVLAAHENRNAVLMPKGDRVVYRSTRAGDMAVYLGEIARPEISPKRLWGCPGGCQLLGVSQDGEWAALRLGGPDEPNGKVVALRVDGGSPRVDESAERVAKLSPVRPEVPSRLLQSPACGPALPGATLSIRADVGAVGVADGLVGAMTWESPLTPADLWHHDSTTGVLSRLRNEARPGLAGLGDAQLLVDHRAAALALVPRGPVKTVVVVEGAATRPPAAWDPVARALAGAGHAVVRSCRGDPTAHPVLLRWLDRQNFATDRPRVWVNAGPGVGLAVRRMVEAGGGGAAIEAPWWWGESELDRRERPTSASPPQGWQPTGIELSKDAGMADVMVLFDVGLLDVTGRRLIAHLRWAGALVVYRAEALLVTDRPRPKLWRRASRLAALLRFLDEVTVRHTQP